MYYYIYSATCIHIYVYMSITANIYIYIHFLISRLYAADDGGNRFYIYCNWSFEPTYNLGNTL